MNRSCSNLGRDEKHTSHNETHSSTQAVIVVRSNRPTENNLVILVPGTRTVHCTRTRQTCIPGAVWKIEGLGPINVTFCMVEHIEQTLDFIKYACGKKLCRDGILQTRNDRSTWHVIDEEQN